MSAKKATKKPVKKTATKKRAVKKPVKKLSLVQSVKEDVQKLPKVCRSCNTLPVGSMELVSLLLVVTFSLSAILLTSVYAMQQQSSEIDN